MNENPKVDANQMPEEKAKELTQEELDKVAGGIPIGLVPSEPTTQGHDGWIEINSFQWGGE